MAQRSPDIGAIALLAGGGALAVWGIVQSLRNGNGNDDDDDDDGGDGITTKLSIVSPPKLEAVSAPQGQVAISGETLPISNATLVIFQVRYSLRNDGATQRGVTTRIRLKRDIPLGADLTWVSFDGITGQTDKSVIILPLNVTAGPGISLVDPNSTIAGTLFITLDGPDAGFDEWIAWKNAALTSLNLFAEIDILDAPVSAVDIDRQTHVVSSNVLKPSIHIDFPLFSQDRPSLAAGVFYGRYRY